MAVSHRVYLLPGFFGFANLGELVYFRHVKTALESAFALRGVTVSVVAVSSRPTASIRSRAADALKTISATAGADDGPVHLVGHSTGGLDARMLVTPEVALGEGIDAGPLARRVRTVVTVATPHRGTPLANFFVTYFGSQLLDLLSLFTIYALRFGRVPLPLVLKVTGLLIRLDKFLGWKSTLVEELFQELLGNLSPERSTALRQFFTDVRADRSLIPQLTPEGMDVLNATCTDRPGVRYGSVVTRAAAPTLGSFFQAGFSPYAQATHTLFAFLYARARRLPAQSVPTLTSEQVLVMTESFGAVPPATANDGIVPTISQPYGVLLSAVQADHLDVIGHFGDSTTEPPHVDWLLSGSKFRLEDFNRLWQEVADFLIGAARPEQA